MSIKQGIAFDGLPMATFDGTGFPVDEITVKSSLRHHVHEYPHTPGGDPEKLGRKLYEIAMRIPCHDNFDAYPLLWPDGLVKLREAYEAEKTATLVIPTVGSIDAFITTWSQKSTALVRSGELLELTFLEDQSTANLTIELSAGNPDLEFPNDALALALAGVVPKPTIFDDINDAVGAVQAVIGQADLYGRLVAAKIQKVADLCAEADRTVDALQDCRNSPILEALKNLWSASLSLAQNVTGKAPQLQTWTTPRKMSITDVSAAIYGDSTRAMEILQINPIDDAFAIPAGVTLKYYAAEGVLQGARAA